MNKLYDTLIKIKNQPGLYLGKPSIERLSMFLNGFTLSCSLYQGNKNDCEILNGFQSYIKKISY